MTHDELLAKINNFIYSTNRLEDASEECDCADCKLQKSLNEALRAVVELHKPFPLTWKGKILGTGEPYEYTKYYCSCAHWTSQPYPCPTIQAIEKGLE